MLASNRRRTTNQPTTTTKSLFFFFSFLSFSFLTLICGQASTYKIHRGQIKIRKKGPKKKNRFQGRRVGRRFLSNSLLALYRWFLPFFDDNRFYQVSPFHRTYFDGILQPTSRVVCADLPSTLSKKGVDGGWTRVDAFIFTYECSVKINFILAYSNLLSSERAV